MRTRSYLLVWFIYQAFIYPVNAQNHDKNISDSLFFTAIRDVIEDYYSYYYQFPDSSQQVLEFVDGMIGADKDKSLYFLTPHSAYNYFTIRKCFHTGIVSIYKSDKSIHVKYNGLENKYPIEHMGFQVCEIDSMIGEFSSDYNGIISRFSNGRFFDLKGKTVIITEELNMRLHDIQCSLQKEYLSKGTFAFRKYKYQDMEIPVQAVMVYDIMQGLRYYCLEKEIDNELLYYKVLEASLKEFCNINNLSRMFFLMPDYYSTK